MKKKTCTICKIEQSINNFRKTSNGRGKFGVGCQCISCLNEKCTQYRKENAEIITIKRRIYQKNNREKTRLAGRISYQKHRNKRLKYSKKYSKKYRKIRNKWYNEKRKNDPLFKLKQTIKKAIQQALKHYGYSKKSKIQTILGCTFENLKKYIESKWEPWMNWGNHGKFKKGTFQYGWDIDHIVPISSAKNRKDIEKLNHYTNLQPLCSYINRYIKKDNICGISTELAVASEMN